MRALPNHYYTRRAEFLEEREQAIEELLEMESAAARLQDDLLGPEPPLAQGPVPDVGPGGVST